MVKRRRASTRVKKVKVGGKVYACKPTKASKAKYKKCILTAIRGTKITTRKGAQKAFRAAAVKCGVHLAGTKARRSRKKSSRRKVTTVLSGTYAGREAARRRFQRVNAKRRR